MGTTGGKTRAFEAGQHFNPNDVDAEAVFGKAGTSAVRQDPCVERDQRHPRHVMPDDGYRSARTDFAELKWKVKPEVQFCDATKPKESLGMVRAESWRLDPRGMLLKLWLPTMEWLKYLLTKRVLLKITIAMPALGANVNTVAHVAWAEALGQNDPSVAVGVLFEGLNILDRDRLLRFASSLKNTARGQS